MRQQAVCSLRNSTWLPDINAPNTYTHTLAVLQRVHLPWLCTTTCGSLLQTPHMCLVPVMGPARKVEPLQA